MQFILASTSPRRRQLFATLQIPFRVLPPLFAEKTMSFLSPREEAAYLAYHKASSLVPRFPQAWILGCDTLIEFENQKWGKPQSSGHALEMLLAMSGKSHQVWTALALYQGRRPHGQDKTWQCWQEVTEVKMRPFSPKEAEAYVATGEPLGKAGAYALQGLGANLIEAVQGEKENVIGLPLIKLRQKLSGMQKYFK